MPFPNWIGGRQRYWTRERVLAGLVLAGNTITGRLPCHDLTYETLKEGRLEWPTAHRVLEYFGSMARGWLAAGFPRSRVSLANIEWTPDEETYVKERAGMKTIKQIAADLLRSYGSVKRRMYKLGIKARDNQGYFSAAELAKEYNCPIHRVRDALAADEIKGKFDKVRNRWQVDIKDLTPGAMMILQSPKRTWTSTSSDQGDYYSRYGLRRTVIDGRTVVVLDRQIALIKRAKSETVVT